MYVLMTNSFSLFSKMNHCISLLTTYQVPEHVRNVNTNIQFITLFRTISALTIQYIFKAYPQLFVSVPVLEVFY